MQNLIIKQLVKKLIPALLGALAMYLSTNFPEVYNTVCGPLS